MEQLDKTLEEYLVKKAPFTIPGKWREVLVQWLPWITLVLFIIALPAVLTLLGISAFLMPLSYVGGVGYGLGYNLSMVVLVVTLVLEALAIPGLFKRSAKAWKLLYYSTLLNAVYHLLTLDIFGLIIGTLISLYILFQIRSYYK